MVEVEKEVGLNSCRWSLLSWILFIAIYFCCLYFMKLALCHMSSQFYFTYFSIAKQLCLKRKMLSCCSTNFASHLVSTDRVISISSHFGMRDAKFRLWEEKSPSLTDYPANNRGVSTLSTHQKPHLEEQTVILQFHSCPWQNPFLHYSQAT